MPAERITMHHVRKVLRLKFVGGVPTREFARRIGVAASTVRTTLERFHASGLSWLLPEEMTDAMLEARLFANAGTKQGHRRHIEPDWAAIHRELKRKHVTLSFLWDEYIERDPHGYRYSRFCELYRSREARLSVTMRQTHVGGDKLFVDYAGNTVPVIIDRLTGEVRQAQIFVAVMCASNITYMEATWTQGLGDWIGAHTRASDHQSTPPDQRDYRKALMVLAAVPVGGLCLGLGLAFFRELMDCVFRTEQQVETVLGTTCLATIPMWKATEPKDRPSRSWPHAGSRAPRRIVRDQPLLWLASDAPLSRFAESIRSIKTAADLIDSGNSIRVIGFTSTLPNEGKSTAAAGLAQIIAQSGSRVILVDCDLRNPSLSSSLAPNADFGLLDVISGKMALDDVICVNSSTNMAFLPAIIKSRLVQTTEILVSDATKRLFDRLRLSYDYVVVDLSPLGPVADVRATTNLVDSYVFVIEWGRTNTSAVQRALRSAPDVNDNLLGVALNKTDLKLLKRYDTHLSEYYSNERYEH